MKKILFLLAAAGSFGLNAQTYKLAETIAVGNNNRWDYVSFDSVNGNIFVSNAVQVLAVSADTHKIVATIPNTKGVHGIAINNKLNRGYISNGKGNSVYVFDLKNFKVTDSVATKGENPDAIMVDDFSGNIFVMNGKTNNVNVFSADKLQLIKDITLPGKPEFAVNDAKGNVFVNLEDKSQIAWLDSKTNTLKSAFSIAPGEEPTGLAIDKKNNLLFSVCANKNLIVFDISSKKVLKNLPIGEDADALVFDPETKNIFVSNADGTLDIYHQNNRLSYTKIQTLSTPKRSKTLGYDSKTKDIYLPAAEFEEKKVINNSFRIQIYKIK